MADEVILTIDGAEVKTRAGATVMDAAMDAGIYIPYLCHYPGIKPYGACRMCIVEAEQKGPDGEYRAIPGTPASCTTPVAEGMIVRTDTAKLRELRRGIMELLLTEHPHGCLTCHRVDLCGPSDICLRHVSVNDRCVTCPKNERCELKDTVRYLQMEMETPLTYNNRHLPLQVADPYWEMDMNLCIACIRCVRVCGEVRGDTALAVLQRSDRILIGTSQGTSLLESGCEFCGACIDVCPTGTLVERAYKWDKSVKTVTSICPQCPVGCQLDFEVNKRNTLVRLIPDRHAAANRGQACFKGKFGLDFVNSKQRLRNPLVRSNGSLEESSWDDALDMVADRLRRIEGRQYALLASARGTNEDNYVAQRFARTVMKTNNVDLSSNINPDLVHPLGELLGYPAATNSVWELESSSCFLVVSSNVTEEQNVVAVPIKMAVTRGASLIVIDQRETELTRYAKVWLRPKPGSEPTLIAGMLRVIIDESLDDHEFLAGCCENSEDLTNSLWDFDLMKVERTTGIPQSRIQEAARLFAATKPGAILYALETLEPQARESCVRALVNLALATGNLGARATGIYPLFTGANEQGSKDVGCSPDYLPGYASVTDQKARQRFQDSWGADIPASKGLSIKDLTDAIHRKQIRALHVIGDSPNFYNGELGDFIEALKGLDFLVVQDAFIGDITEHADVVLPSNTFAETDGTYTNIERRVQRLRPALDPRGAEEADWKILGRIAARMGVEGFGFPDAEAIFDEVNGLVEIYGGISYQRLQEGGVQWPCLAADMTDTPVLYAGLLEVNKPRAGKMSLSAPKTHDDPDFPFLLASGRVLNQPDREVEIVRPNGRNEARRKEIIELHESDAADLGISTGDEIEVSTAKATLAGMASLTGPQRGLVSTTTLFGQLISELEHSDEPDPMLKVPRLPLVPARVSKIASKATAR